MGRPSLCCFVAEGDEEEAAPLPYPDTRFCVFRSTTRAFDLTNLPHWTHSQIKVPMFLATGPHQGMNISILEVRTSAS